MNTCSHLYCEKSQHSSSPLRSCRDISVDTIDTLFRHCMLVLLQKIEFDIYIYYLGDTIYPRNYSSQMRRPNQG